VKVSANGELAHSRSVRERAERSEDLLWFGVTGVDRE
jgi:hypothetical protein